MKTDIPMGLLNVKPQDKLLPAQRRALRELASGGLTFPLGVTCMVGMDRLRLHEGNTEPSRSGCLKVPTLAAIREWPVPHLDSPVEIERVPPGHAGFDDFPTITRADWNYVARCCLANGDHKGT